MLPAAPGFVGTYQWLTVMALGFFSVDETLAFAIGVLLNFSVIIINVGTGLIAYFFLKCESRTKPAATYDAHLTKDRIHGSE